MKCLLDHKVHLHIQLYQEREILKAKEIVLMSGHILKGQMKRTVVLCMIDGLEEVGMLGGARYIGKTSLNLMEDAFVIASNQEATCGKIL